MLPLTVAGFDEDAASTYGHVRAALENDDAGSHDLSLDVTLVTNNSREFARVPDLAVENRVGNNES